MALDPVKNFAIVTLASGYSDVATSVNLIGGDGAKLPTPSIDGNFNMVYWNATDYANPSDDPNKEIVRVTARSTDTLTITRAQEGTAATNKNTGGKTYKMILAFTKKMRDDIDSLLSLDTDGTLAANSDTKIASQKAVKTYTAPMSEFITGWHAAGETPTYASIDSPTGVITVASGAKTKYPIGCKIKFDQSQALTSYWSFDANSNDGVGSNNGTDTAMSYTAGKFSNAATFNGTTSKIVVADAASLKPTGEFTIGGWFKTGTTGVIKGMFQSASSNTNLAGFKLYVDSSNKVSAWVGNNTGTTLGANFSLFSGTTTVTDNVMHNVVFTYRNNWAQIYLDGNLEISGYCLSPAYAATNYVRLGCQNDTGTDSSFMNGQLDDWYLINGYALDQDTIKAKYDAGTAQGTGSITVTKKGIVTATTDTTVTAYYGTDYTLANSAITNFFYSLMKSPLGFPIDPVKWTVESAFLQTAGQATPASGTWYNIGSWQIVKPIGAFNTRVLVGVNASTNVSGGGARVYSTLSEGNNSESDPDFTTFSEAAVLWTSGVTFNNISALVFKEKTLNSLVKKTYYVNLKTDVANIANIYVLGGVSKCFVRMTNAYL